MKTITFHNDAGHGWYAVKRKELAKLGILDKITAFLMKEGKQYTWKRIAMPGLILKL